LGLQGGPTRANTFAPHHNAGFAFRPLALTMSASPRSPARRRHLALTWALAAAPLLLVAVLVAWAAWPVCVALPQEALTTLNPPIEQREDRMWQVRTFQQRDGQWHHCKPRIARIFFF
jgi:hypothetical protein